MRYFALATGLFAAAAFAGAPDCKEAPCLTAVQAQEVANHFEGLIKDFHASDAVKWLAPDYHDYSSSVNTLINNGCPGPLPLNAPTFTNRAGFIAGQGKQAPIPFEQLNIWHTCDTVFIRWRTTVAHGAPEPVTGIIVLETEYSHNEYLIKTVYSEFNSGAWLVDIGLFTPTCPPPPPPSKRSIARTLPRRMI